MDGPISQIHRNSLIIKGENIILRTILSIKFLGVRINLLHAVYVISGNFLAKVP